MNGHFLFSGESFFTMLLRKYSTWGLVMYCRNGLSTNLKSVSRDRYLNIWSWLQSDSWLFEISNNFNYFNSATGLKSKTWLLFKFNDDNIFEFFKHSMSIISFTCKSNYCSWTNSFKQLTFVILLLLRSSCFSDFSSLKLSTSVI